MSALPEILQERATVSTGGSLSTITPAIAVALVYFLAAELSLCLLAEPDGSAVFWPAAGIAAGVLIGFGRVARVPVVVGTIAATMAADLLGDRNMWSAAVFSVCNAGEAVLVASLIESMFASPFKLDSVNHVMGLVLVATIGPAVSGLGGMAGFLLFHRSAAYPLTIWWHWFASDATGIITVAPLFIELPRLRKDNPIVKKEFLEGILALAILSAVSAFVIQMQSNLWTGESAIATVFPFLLWIAVRCRPVFAAAAVFLCSIAIVWTTTFGIGFFGDPNLPMAERVLPAQASIVAVALCELVLAALFAERRRHVHIIAERESRMRAIVNTVAEGIITVDDKGIIENVNPAGALMFDYSPEDVVGGNVQMLISAPCHQEFNSYFNSDQAKTVIGLRRNGTTFPMELAISEMALGGRPMFVAAMRDITKRVRNAEHQKVLMAELDHRVKNSLARVAMLVASTRKVSTSIDEYVRSLNGRIQSMAAAHNLLSQSGWQNVELGPLVRNQLAPYATDANVTIQGEDILLGAAEVQALAMVLHELVTNAAKYGSLCVPDGQVSVTWDIRELDGGAKLVVQWQEAGGPTVTAKGPSGYGSNLIRDLIPHELEGTVDLIFAPDGVSCKIEVPLESTWIADRGLAHTMS